MAAQTPEQQRLRIAIVILRRLGFRFISRPKRTSVTSNVTSLHYLANNCHIYQAVIARRSNDCTFHISKSEPKIMAASPLDALNQIMQALSLPPLPSTSNLPADVLSRPLDIARLYLADTLSQLVEACEITTAWNSITQPADLDAGDFAVILPKLYGKGKGDWHVIGFELTQKFLPSPLFQLPFADGVHLRILLNPSTLFQVLLPYLSQRGRKYGLPTSAIGIDAVTASLDEVAMDSGQTMTKTGGNGKQIVLEFSSPNIPTPFATRHLRSTIVGIFLKNLYTSLGYTVHTINYIGDWGKQLALLGVGVDDDNENSTPQDKSDEITYYEEVFSNTEARFLPEQAASRAARDNKTGEEAEIESRGLFKERNEWFAALERGEASQVQLFEKVRDIYVAHYVKLYNRLGIKFDSYDGESSVKSEIIAEVENILREKGVLEEVEGGSLIVDLKKHGKDKKVKSGVCIIRDRGGSSTYLSRELASALERNRLHGGTSEKLIYVVEAGQGVHFGRVQVLLELMGFEDVAAKIQHIGFGELTRSADEKQNLLESVFATTKSALETTLAEEAEKAAVLQSGSPLDIDLLVSDTLLLHELSIRRSNDYSIDNAKATSFEAGTALCFLYWLKRLDSVVNENRELSDIVVSTVVDSKLGDEDQNNLLRLLVQYPDVTAQVFKSLESAPLVAYLASVASQIEACLHVEDEGVSIEDLPEYIQTVDEGIALGKDVPAPVCTKAEVALYGAAKSVLENGLRLLGLRSEV
jgi:arginyl-tRNA synthetase